MKSLRIRYIFSIALAGIIMVSLWLFLRQRTSSLAGEVFDAANGMPVYGARVTFGKRTTTLYTSKEFRLTSLPKGTGTLTVTAPGFYEEIRQFTLRGRTTAISVPLRGKEVPGLGGILVWSEWEGEDLRLDIRLTTAAGKGIEHFPALSFGAEVRLSENLGTPQAPVRGQLLFDGRPRLYLDLSSKLEKLKCKIGLGEIIKPQPDVDLGVLDFTLHTNQGTFTWSRGDITFEQGKT